MNDGARTLRIQLLIGFMCAALLVYFLMLGRTALALIASGEPAPIGLGVALLALASHHGVPVRGVPGEDAPSGRVTTGD